MSSDGLNSDLDQKLSEDEFKEFITNHLNPLKGGPMDANECENWMKSFETFVDNAELLESLGLEQNLDLLKMTVDAFGRGHSWRSDQESNILALIAKQMRTLINSKISFGSFVVNQKRFLRALLPRFLQFGQRKKDSDNLAICVLHVFLDLRKRREEASLLEEYEYMILQWAKAGCLARCFAHLPDEEYFDYGIQEYSSSYYDDRCHGLFFGLPFLVQKDMFLLQRHIHCEDRGMVLWRLKSEASRGDRNNICLRDTVFEEAVQELLNAPFMETEDKINRSEIAYELNLNLNLFERMMPFLDERKGGCDTSLKEIRRKVFPLPL